MKHRAGFVSNSSSSSFIVFGNKISNPKSLTAKDLKRDIRIIGKYLSEGEDFISIADKKMLEYAQNNDNLKNRVWLEVFTTLNMEAADDSGMFVLPKNLPEGLSVTTLDVDYHSSDDLERLKWNYDED